jgi:uncharacterized membrane protein YphA (DoxX/SURF4 family)
VRAKRAACAIVIAVALPSAAQAHEKWFLSNAGYPLRWDLFFSSGPVVCVAIVAAVTIAMAFLWRARGHRDFLPEPESFGATPEGRRIVYALLPLIIGLHVAVPMLYDGLHGLLFSPNVHLPGAAAYIFGVAEIWVGLSLFYGGLARLAAVVLATLWIAGIAVAGIQSMLDNTLYLGVAAFFFLAGRGPIAIDRFMFPRFEPPAAFARHAVTALRIGLGVSFVVVSFTEKLANLPYALAFLQRYPINITPYSGIPLSNHAFVLATGSVELLIGLSLVFGVFTREIIIVAWLPINLTLTYFNTTELIGHLPIYGIMALLLIWIPGKINRERWVAALLPAASVSPT